MENNKEAILKKHPQFSRTDFGLAGDGTKEYIQIKDAGAAMEEYAADRVKELKKENEAFKIFVDGRNKYINDLHEEQEQLTADRDYWKQRCEAAEKVLSKAFKIDMVEAQVVSKEYHDWQYIKNQNP